MYKTRWRVSNHHNPNPPCVPWWAYEVSCASGLTYKIVPKGKKELSQGFVHIISYVSPLAIHSYVKVISLEIDTVLMFLPFFPTTTKVSCRKRPFISWPSIFFGWGNYIRGKKIKTPALVQNLFFFTTNSSRNICKFIFVWKVAKIPFSSIFYCGVDKNLRLQNHAENTRCKKYKKKKILRFDISLSH